MRSDAQHLLQACGVDAWRWGMARIVARDLVSDGEVFGKEVFVCSSILMFRLVWLCTSMPMSRSVLRLLTEKENLTIYVKIQHSPLVDV